MKKRIIFTIAIVFFAFATVFNMKFTQMSNFSDISVESISLMAQAQIESGDARRCIKYHDEGCFWYTGTHDYTSCAPSKCPDVP
jgi:hypothetical protein